MLRNKLRNKIGFIKNMRALLLHANKFATKVVLKSNWPKGIEPEIKDSSSEKVKQRLVCFFV